MPRITVIESKVWEDGDTGRRVSPYGVLPYHSDNWKLVSTGWTTLDNNTGQVGTGRVPCKTREEAEVLATKLNSIMSQSGRSGIGD
jgi:hypothetical protein